MVGSRCEDGEFVTPVGHLSGHVRGVGVGDLVWEAQGRLGVRESSFSSCLRSCSLVFPQELVYVLGDANLEEGYKK